MRKRLIQRILIILTGIGIACGAAACDGNQGSPQLSTDEPSTSGFVISPKGGIYPDLGGGLHIDNKGQLGVGFPF